MNENYILICYELKNVNYVCSRANSTYGQNFYRYKYITPQFIENAGGMEADAKRPQAA